MHHKTHTQKARAQTRLPPEEDPEFQIAPMIDILLVLLVFFMSISSTEVLQTNDKVRLPVAKDGKDANNVPEGQVIVNVLWNSLSNAGTLDVDGKTFADPAEIAPILSAKAATTPDVRVLVRADKEVKYEYLKKLLLAVGAAKIANVTFSVVDKEGAGR
jgi:biopolymer transport protein ExbD